MKTMTLAVRALHLVLDADEPLAERAAQLRARHQAAHVELEQHPPCAARAMRRCASALHDGGLADAWLAHQHGVVGAALAKDVEQLVDLAIAAQRGIELAFDGKRGEVAGVGAQPRVFARVEQPRRSRAARFRLGLGSRLALRLWRKGGDPGRDGRRLGALAGHHRRASGGDRRGHFPAPRDGAGQRPQGNVSQRGHRRCGALEQPGGGAAGEARERHQEVEAGGLRAAAIVGELPGLLQRLRERVGRLTGRSAQRRQLRQHLVLVAAALAQERVGRAGHGEDGEQQVLGARRLADVSCDVLGLGSDLRKLWGVVGHVVAGILAWEESSAQAARGHARAGSGWRNSSASGRDRPPQPLELRQHGFHRLNGGADPALRSPPEARR